MPYQSTTLADTFIVAGTDMQGLDGVYMDDLAFLQAPGTLRGNSSQDGFIPGRRGLLGVELPYDAYPFTVPVEVRPVNSSEVPAVGEAAQRGLMLVNLRALSAAIVGTGGIVILTRRLTNSGGTGYDTTRARGQFMGGLTPTNSNDTSALRADLELQFVNLSGGWTADALPADPIDDAGLTWVVP